MSEFSVAKAVATKAAIIFLSFFLLSGCATYKFQHGAAPYDKGYVVSRDGYTIPEYTLGKDNMVPSELDLAKERFKRRRHIVEDFYKKMGAIENRFKQGFADYPVMMSKLVTGVFRLPFIGVSDYRYDHDPKYREKIQKIEHEQDLKEQSRVAQLKEKLSAYIQNDLTQEKNRVVSVEASPISPAAAETSMPTQVPASEAVTDSSGSQPAAISEPVVTEAASKTTPPPSVALPSKAGEKEISPGQIKAIIVAKPVKGFSPLKVRFYGNKSFSKQGRLVYYSWDFGDGDVSTKSNPINTYYSGSFKPRQFTVTLTVNDSKGNTDTATSVIEVLNK